MDKHIQIKFVPKNHLKLRFPSTVIHTRNKRRKRIIYSHPVSRVSPWTKPRRSQEIQSAIIATAGSITYDANQSLLTSILSVEDGEQSSRKTLSDSKKQSMNQKKTVISNRWMVFVISMALLVFTILTIATYLIIRFATKSTNTTVANATLRWHLTAMMVAGIGGTSGLSSNQLGFPVDMALDSSDTLYVSDFLNNRVQKWKTDSPNGTTVAGQASGTIGMTAVYLTGPIGVLVDSNSNIYVSDSSNHRIQFWANGASNGTTVAETGTLGAAYNQLHTPQFISRDLNTNTLYIADFNNHRVMSYASGASNGTLIIGGQGAGINNTQLNGPVGIYFDSMSNNLYICNYLGHHIVRWIFGATSWTLVAGTPGVLGSSSTLLSSPNGITLDPMGNLYVADTANSRVQLFLVGQTVATTIAGITLSPGSSSVQLNAPYSVRLDNQLNLYVADLTNNRIEKFLRY